MIVNGTAQVSSERPYHVAYIGRKSSRQYKYSHEAVLAECGEHMCHHEPIDGVFAAAIGNYGYILRSSDLDDVLRLAEFIQQEP
jgi:hypothetical protein